MIQRVALTTCNPDCVGQNGGMTAEVLSHITVDSLVCHGQHA